MNYTVRQLRAEIKDAAAQLPPSFLPKGVSRMVKNELEHVLASLRTELANRRAEAEALHNQPMAGSPAAVAQAEEADESVNELVDGAEVMREWLALDPANRSHSLAEQRNRLQAVHAGTANYQSAQEALLVLDSLDAASEAAYAEMAAQVDALVERELAAQRQREMIKEQGRVATQAWRNTPVAFTSMGQAVQGRVVAVTLRPREARGHTSYDFLMTVAHDGHPTRRTLHALRDIKPLVLAS